MSKAIAFVITLAFLLGSAIAGIRAGSGPQDADLVRICHFPSHASPEGLHDFVAGNQDPDNAHACTARGEGSVPIFVSEEACENGHAAVTAPNGTSCTSH